MYKQNKDNAKLQLIYDETNISKDNCFKSLFEIILKLLLILISIYAITYFLLGIIIDKLSLEQQILLENSISKLIKKPDNITSDDDTARFNKIKKKHFKKR